MKNVNNKEESWQQNLILLYFVVFIPKLKLYIYICARWKSICKLTWNFNKKQGIYIYLKPIHLVRSDFHLSSGISTSVKLLFFVFQIEVFVSRLFSIQSQTVQRNYDLERNIYQNHFIVNLMRKTAMLKRDKENK